MRKHSQALCLLGVLSDGLLLGLAALLRCSQHVMRLGQVLLCLLEPLPGPREVHTSHLRGGSGIPHD